MRLDNMNRFRSVAMAMAIISSGTLCAQTGQSDIMSESVDGSRGHFVYAALGYGNITSRIEGNWDSGNAHSGFDWQLGYEWVSKKHIGAGFLYSGYYTSGDVNRSGSKYGESMVLTYLAPQFCGRLPFGSGKWNFIYGAGFGLAAIIDNVSARSDSSSSKTLFQKTWYGFGTNLKAGVEYVVKPQFHMNFSVSYIVSSVKQDLTDLGYYGPEGNGVARICFNLGFVCHL